MKQAKLMKQIVALALALMLGLSALGGIVMAFAIEDPAEDWLPEETSDNLVYVPMDEDWEVVAFDGTQDTATLQFDELAALTLTPSDRDLLWVGWDNQYTVAMDQLGIDQKATFDVINFVFTTQLSTPGTMTITTKNPYLYRFSGGVATLIESEYTDGVHTFQTNTLDCFLASNVKLV